jgi:transketolase
MRKQFKLTLADLSAADDRIVVLFGDISVFLFNDFAQRYPDRFFNLGICENTLVSMAAGLSAQGLIPVVHTIAPFVTERCLEQIKLDLCYNDYPALIVTCGSTYDYAWDGPTHHAMADLGALRLIPSIDLLQPGSASELDLLLRERYASRRTTYVRLSDHSHGLTLPVRFGTGVVVQARKAGLSVVTSGPLLGSVIEACRDLPVNVLYFPTIKPLDRDLLAAFGHTHLAVVHDSNGLFEEVCLGATHAVRHLGPPDRFVSCYGTTADIHRSIGLDAPSIRATVSRWLSEPGCAPPE